MSNRLCPVCHRRTLTLDQTHSRLRVRCDGQKGGCGWAIKVWHREQADAWALFDLCSWQIGHDRISGTLKLRT